MKRQSQLPETNQRHLETLSRIHSFIDEMSMKLQKIVEQRENDKLSKYKEELLKTKEEFQGLHAEKSDNAIKEAIFAKKKELEKECSASLEKSMEASRLYENLKEKVTNMQNEEHELEQECLYLQKQIRKAERRKKNLEDSFNRMEININQLMEVRRQSKKSEEKKRKSKKQFSIAILGERINEQKKQSTEQEAKLASKQHLTFLRTKKWQEDTENRLKAKIESTKDYISSLIFSYSAIEQIFEPIPIENYPSDKSKQNLMEQLLDREDVKAQLYYLIFSDENSYGQGQEQE